MAPLCACSRHRGMIGARFRWKFHWRMWKNRQRRLIRLIEYAFTTLGVRYLEVRVTADNEEAGV